MWLPPYWRGASKIIYAFREDYDPELALVPRLLREGDTFVDVGASFGIYSLLASRSTGVRGKVMAFEPAAATRAVLERNLKLNRTTNVHVFASALAERAGRARLSHEADTSRNALVPAGGDTMGSEEIETATLDEILAPGEHRRVKLVKLDIEGAEELALRGASELLRKAAPHIIFEVNPESAARLSLTPDGAWRLLRTHGYVFYRSGMAGAVSRIVEPPAGGNVVAIHQSRTNEFSDCRS